ncbi:heavy metal translocating P-type ATPase metal-binding domain-containing protein [Dyadobacter sp. CY261]|uniref:heavy metal translocating P-type ATPase n=1 Tax=Dyadobacter sp. CY261 TaxID=2907203 RepID=UPI001F48C768|nr:heavy metal translocating P-type ATPase metal-binding domain-containing protein [Dyadobacter sp. CY261]MCF0071200.1 heavy metal translocating P-type ATPase metal-binding domain-containing protein [Dyadobacter sp. CY261]
MNILTPPEAIPDTRHVCYHCGEDCRDEVLHSDAHDFCCEGCMTVYGLLKDSDLCQYYAIEGAQGISPDSSFYKGKYDHLDLPEVYGSMIEFTDGRLTTVYWYLPKMHCSSCIWLLEHLYRLNPAVRSSVVNFPEKKVRITFNATALRLSELAALLTGIGYEPYLSMDDLSGKKANKWNRTRLYKIGIAGFAFGNIMMLSFPEYFHLGQNTSDQNLRTLFGALNLALSLPVLFYCAADFYKSAWSALKGRYLNIDAPIALALSCVFLISLYQLATQTGPGYLDSFAGAVFFMLVGRYFQDKTYAGVSFDRDYKSYFPIAISILDNGQETRKPITDLQKGDRMLVRNEELIPADAVLQSPVAMIDYSFVSGESQPIERRKGDTIYAGGKQKGTAIELEVLRETSQSYLTQLWNDEAFTHEKDDANKSLAARINRYFSLTVLGIAAVTFLIWFFVFKNPETAFLAFTTTLLVACPCALLLSSTFTNGNLLSVFSRNRFYPKNAHSIERLAQINAVVFDKTGTITLPDDAEINFTGAPSTREELVMTKSLVGQSSHPLSRLLAKHLADVPASRRVLSGFSEISGKGMMAQWGLRTVKAGSASWVGANAAENPEQQSSRVYVAIDDIVKGYFTIRSKYRPELPETLATLRKAGIRTYLLSGDRPTDLDVLNPLFGQNALLLFNQKPEQKLDFVRDLQQKGSHVLMVGDGLNDAGALRQSDVGLAVSDDINNFSPSCDAIVEGSQLSLLPGYISLARSGQRIIRQSFAISLIYNILGLSFAVTGHLSPVIAAILMPVSSITIVAFTTLASNAAAKRYLKN